MKKFTVSARVCSVPRHPSRGLSAICMITKIAGPGPVQPQAGQAGKRKREFFLEEMVADTSLRRSVGKK